jgi:hypothetical protein
MTLCIEIEYTIMPCILGVDCIWLLYRLSLVELYLLRLCLIVVLIRCSLSPF